MQDKKRKIPVKIAYIGGGSTNWAVKLMADLASNTRLKAQVNLFDLDKSAAERNAKIGNHFASVSQGAPALYHVSDSLELALEGVDIIIISILPGTLEDMANDINIPQHYGIPQAVGDTVGPGGFVRAMRSIPMMADIGNAIKRYAPTAYVCNLTNPMSILTGALYQAFPDIKAWGECHEVTKIRKQVAMLANQDEPIAPYTHRDVEANVLGINHFTFVDQLSVAGRDMMPAYKAFVAAHKQKGWAGNETSDDAEHAKYFESRNLVAFDLFERFGLPAAAGDRHLAEFLPLDDYLADPGKWGFGLTPISYRQKDRAQKIAKLQKLLGGDEIPVVQRTDEAITDQIEALLGGEFFLSNVNLPNKGQLTGIPEGTIVETNALFSGNGVKPVYGGELPRELFDIVEDHALRQNALLTAVLAGEYTTLRDLFCTDPLVRSLPTTTAQKLFDEMVASTAHLLPTELRGAA